MSDFLDKVTGAILAFWLMVAALVTGGAAFLIGYVIFKALASA